MRHHERDVGEIFGVAELPSELGVQVVANGARGVDAVARAIADHGATVLAATTPVTDLTIAEANTPSARTNDPNGHAELRDGRRGMASE